MATSRGKKFGLITLVLVAIGAAIWGPKLIAKGKEMAAKAQGK